MSEVEARTRAALHEIVGGVDVTDHDVARMEADLLTALDPRRRPGGSHVRALGPVRRRWGLAAAAVAAVAAIAGGIALSSDGWEPARPAGAPPSDQPLVPPELVGLWREVPNSPHVWEFTADGRVGWTKSANGYLSGEAIGSRVTRRVGDVLTLAPSEARPECHGDHRFVITSPMAASVTNLSTTCDVPPGWGTLLERISPETSPGDAVIPLMGARPQSTVRSVDGIRGSWLHAASGTILVVGGEKSGPWLTYLIDDDGDGSTAPDQRGLVSVRPDGSGQVRPFASADADCTPSFAGVVSDGATLSTTSGRDGCFPPGSTQVWISLN